MKHQNKTDKKQKSFVNIEAGVFITVMVILAAVLAVSGALSYFIPQGSFLRDESGMIIEGTYQSGQISGIAIWRIITAPIRVFASEDAVTIIVISIFLLVMSGVFNLLEKIGGIKAFIERLISKLGKKQSIVICLTSLIFMLFGSLFGMFEELVTLLPIVIMMMISMNMDTMMGLGACLMSACFGFSAAMTNPFSVGLASQVAGQAISSGMWLRVVFFVLTYATVCAFLLLHLKKIKKNPESSLSYEIDVERRASMAQSTTASSVDEDKTFKSFLVFFGIQAVLLVLIATVRAISGLAIPLLAASFLICGIICSTAIGNKLGKVLKYILDGAVAMLPAVLIIAVASSAKLVMTESGILDTVMNYAINVLSGQNKYVAILMIYLLILFLQMFIGSASAKIILVMPVVLPIAKVIGFSPSLVILAYCMADGFTDVILPTNPVLMVGLSMANVSYAKWVRWTWKLQVIVFVLTVAVLFAGVAIGY